MIPLLIINKIILYNIMYLLGGGIKKKDTIVIYSGRFQPFHKGHHDVYRFLKQRYDNVFIVTTNTNSKDKKRYPFNFKQKINIMETLGRVEESDIYPEPVKNPYSDYYIINHIRFLKTISDTLSPKVKKRINDINLDNALVMFAISDKDMNPTDGTKPRFAFPSNNLVFTKKTNTSGNPIPAKIQKIKSRKNFENTTFNNIRSNTNINFNYILTVPTNIFNVLGQNINSATQLRNMIIDPPEGYSSINVLESLYDLEVNSSNKDQFEFIIKTLRNAYGIKSPRRKSASSSASVSASASKRITSPASASASASKRRTSPPVSASRSKRTSPPVSASRSRRTSPPVSASRSKRTSPPVSASRSKRTSPHVSVSASVSASKRTSPSNSKLASGSKKKYSQKSKKKKNSLNFRKSARLRNKSK